MKRSRGGVYHFFVTLPDKLYPFKNQVQGQWVRGARSYDRALRRAASKYGPGYYGYKLSLYRQVFHFIGSLLVIYGATYLTLDLIGGRAALAFVLVLFTIAISYQEFFYQRKHYRQHWQKAVADWMVWVAPVGLYAFLFVY